MIIRKNVESKKKSQTSSGGSSAKKNVIKKEDIILDTKSVQDTNQNKEPIAPEKLSDAVKEDVINLEEFEKIDISSIDFKQRVERRRGDRRRGYRRIDERSLVSRAQQEAHSIKELAAREGYKNGLKEAADEIEAIKTSLSEFLSAKDEMYNSFYPHILELSLEIAKKIIKKEVELSPDVLKGVILSVLDEMNSDTEKITIKVHPDDADFAVASLPDIVEAKNLDVKVTIAPDETIEQGSCIVVANNGVIDANFKTQLAVLQNAFGIYKGGI